MWLRPWARIKGKNILLIDDVLTTGKTLEVASNTLQAAGVLSIQVAVLAVTNLPQKGKKM
jgi:predicted amidophosphoribosyltransferase